MPDDELLPPDAAAPAVPPPEAAAAPEPPAAHFAEEAPAADAAETRVETPAGDAVDLPAAPPAAEPPPPAAEAAPPEAAAEKPDEEEADDVSDAEAEAAVAAAEEPPPPPSNKRWYVVKVQSGREDSIKEAIERRVKIERLEEYFGQIIIPVERVTEMRGGKRVVKERKLYPGYLMAEVEYNDRILYLFRETSGVGDFVGGTLNRPPPPMSDREVEKMIGRAAKPGEEKVIVAKPQFSVGDRVKVRDGTFAGMEGEVKEILEAVQKVRVELTIFGRPVPVELEYWQVELA